MTKVGSLVLIVVSLLVFNSESKSQRRKKFNKVDKVMLRIPDSLTFSSQDIASYINSEFEAQDEKARAIFCWIAENIQYDLDNMYAINMHNSDISSEGTLKSRIGNCMNYTNLYSDIANKVGVKTYVVTGYTKKKKIVNQNPHSWCVSMIDSSWYMIDPTWGAGYTQDSQYIKKMDDDYFMAEPESFIKTHIPFDPLWQFLDLPISKKEFHDGISMSKNVKAYFNFRDSIEKYEKQSDIERLTSSSQRIELNGISCYLDYDYLYDLRFNIEVNSRVLDEEVYKVAVNYYNDGVYMLNEYISYANKYYLPYKSDSEIKQMLKDIGATFNLALSQLKKEKYRTSTLDRDIIQLRKSINQALIELNKQNESLEKYLEIAKKYREKFSKSEEK